MRVYASICRCFLILFLLVSLSGCESLQRKFTRKPKHPLGRPSPVIKFANYSDLLTPMDLYQKHFMWFQYWDADLNESLRMEPFNIKRIKQASGNSLQELEALQRLLSGEKGQRMEEVVKERSQIDRKLNNSVQLKSSVGILRRALERQRREIKRSFFWKDVEDQIQSPEPTPES